MPVRAGLVTRGRAAAFTPDPAAASMRDREAAFTPDPEVVSTLGREAACMPVRVGASTKGRPAVCTQVRAAEFIKDRPEGPTLTGGLGVRALPALRVQNGQRKTARTKFVKATGFRPA